MRRRAYRPEVPGCLEGRSLLSGVAGLSADPVVLSLRRLNRVAGHMRFSFGDFARLRVISLLREELHNNAMFVPFGRLDGLGASIDRIVDGMQHDLSAPPTSLTPSARSNTP